MPIEKSCRYCRKEGEKLFLKGEKCLSSKCPFVRRNYGPGQHGQTSKKISDYAKQLRGKQKARRFYRVSETQFRNYFVKARASSSDSEEYFHQLLERRLDNMIYRFGLASSRKAAAQMISHRNFCINKKRLNIPSYLVEVGDEISFYKKPKQVIPKKSEIPAWLNFNKIKMIGKIERLPKKEEMESNLDFAQIIEFYSK